MSCKLLLNLVECIRARSEEEKGQGRELLMRMLEVFVIKFKTIAKLQLPVLMSRMTQLVTFCCLQSEWKGLHSLLDTRTLSTSCLPRSKSLGLYFIV
jgi:hypothetical protein